MDYEVVYLQGYPVRVQDCVSYSNKLRGRVNGEAFLRKEVEVG